MLNRKDISKLWLDYLKESNFKEIHGEARYREYVSRIKAGAKKPEPLTPWPTVRLISDSIEALIDQAYSEAIQRDDTSFENIKKRLIKKDWNTILRKHGRPMQSTGRQLRNGIFVFKKGVM